MKMNDIVDITTLKQFCNYNSNKNWKVFTKNGSPLPHLVISHKKNASGSIQLVELKPSKDNKYLCGIDYLIFSYDSLIGVHFKDVDNIWIINQNNFKTTITTKKVLNNLEEISDYELELRPYKALLEIFGLYEFIYLKPKGEK